MATATPQHASGFNTLSTHVLERWYDKQKAQDIVFEATPLLQLFMMLPGVIQKGNYPHDLLVKLMDEKGAGISSYEYYDTVDTTPTRGSQAARFGFANYSAPLTMSLQEEMEFQSDEAFADRVMEYVEQQELSLADRIADDIYEGNANISTNILGLEQALYAGNHEDSSGGTSPTITDRIVYPWQVRQVDNEYGGIQRVDATSGGAETGWENCAFDAGVSTATNFGLTNGAPNEQLQRFHELYRCCTYGTLQPNVIVMSDIPYDDFEYASFAKTEFRRAPGEFTGANLGFDHTMFKQAIVVRDQRAVSRGGGDSTAGDQMIYMLNTKTWKLHIDSRQDFALSEPKTPVSQHASTRFMLFRGQLVCNNPRLNAVAFSYPVV